MAYRATENEVLAVMDTALTADQIVPYLRTANVIVTAQLTGVYSSDLLREIETWLAAHMAAARDPEIIREKTGQGEWTYAGKYGDGLDSTPYGQRVKLLDALGILAAAANAKGRATLEALTDDA